MLDVFLVRFFSKNKVFARPVIFLYQNVKTIKILWKCVILMGDTFTFLTVIQ